MVRPVARVAVAGGKGGVGKTTVAVNLAVALASRGLSILLADADVDNPNAHVNLGLKAEVLEEITIFSPIISEDKCSSCGLCAQKCPEHALLARPGGLPVFFEDRCSGCKICQLVCPEEAISGGRKTLGHLFSARGRWPGLHVVGAELRPGEARSPLVAKALMEHVEELEAGGRYDMTIVDCPPGVGNTLIQALRGSDLALLVTEPTPFGLSTLRLALRAVEKLSLRAYVVVNRADISGQGLRAVRDICSRARLPVLAEIPYDRVAVEAAVRGDPLVEAYPSSRAAGELARLADRVLGLLGLARKG
ncbi:cobalamin biosynthesis protein CobQ [Candidatus Bathyarchaeota archaeon]|nr:MAG: cobalamin biosynthesis protein CobQ [Candidatus Bathyarchaeota archaeon]